MATVHILYWHHIPTQVKATDDDKEVRIPLSDRFMAAVDQAAMHNNLVGTDAYLAGWRWGKPQHYDGDAAAAAQTTVAQIEQRYEGRAIRLELDQKLDAPR